jgi:hypothetical protein
MGWDGLEWVWWEEERKRVDDLDSIVFHLSGRALMISFPFYL